MTNNYCVYKHTCPGGEVYFGITSLRPEERWTNGGGYSGRFAKAIRNYGWENIESEVLWRNLTEKEALRLENLLISLMCEFDPDKVLNTVGRVRKKQVTRRPPRKNPYWEWDKNIRYKRNAKKANRRFSWCDEAWDNLDLLFGKFSCAPLIQKDHAAFQIIKATSPTNIEYTYLKVSYPDSVRSYDDLADFLSGVTLGDFDAIDEKTYFSEAWASASGY